MAIGGGDALQVEPGQDLCCIGHLGNSTRRYETAEVEGIEADLQQCIQVGDFLGGGDDMWPALHSVAGAFHERERLYSGAIRHILSAIGLGLGRPGSVQRTHGNRLFMASYKIIPVATETLNESKSPAMGMVKCSSAAL